MKDAREMLTLWRLKSKALEVPCDLSAMDGIPAPNSSKITDFYFANLAAKHDMKWATLDEASNHPASSIIPLLPQN